MFARENYVNSCMRPGTPQRGLDLPLGNARPSNDRPSSSGRKLWRFFRVEPANPVARRLSRTSARRPLDAPPDTGKESCRMVMRSILPRRVVACRLFPVNDPSCISHFGNRCLRRDWSFSGPVSLSSSGSYLRRCGRDSVPLAEKKKSTEAQGSRGGGTARLECKAAIDGKCRLADFLRELGGGGRPARPAVRPVLPQPLVSSSPPVEDSSRIRLASPSVVLLAAGVSSVEIQRLMCFGFCMGRLPELSAAAPGAPTRIANRYPSKRKKQSPNLIVRSWGTRPFRPTLKKKGLSVLAQAGKFSWLLTD